MPNRLNFIAAGIAVVALLAGLAVKADRYASPEIPGAADFAATLAARFEAAGWQAVTPDPALIETAYQSLAFRRADCGASLNVMLLGHTADLAAFLRKRFPGNLVLVQDGRTVDEFNARKLQLERLWHTIAARVSKRVSPPPPLAAVTPAPAGWARECPQIEFPALDDVFATATRPASPVHAALTWPRGALNAFPSDLKLPINAGESDVL
jgi:hypothetical protein